MEYIVQLWEKHLEPLLKPLWDSVIFWRSITLLLLTLGVLAYIFRRRLLLFILREKIHAHDADIFAKADHALPERFLYDTIDMLEADNSCAREAFSQMMDFEAFYDLEANKFLDPTLHRAATDLSGSLATLTQFIAYNFFPYPPGTNRTCLYPNLNIDREGDGSPESMSRYEQFRIQLQSLTKPARSKYRVFRSAVKNRLLK